MEVVAGIWTFKNRSHSGVDKQAEPVAEGGFIRKCDFRHRLGGYGNTDICAFLYCCAWRRCLAEPRLWGPFVPCPDSGQLKNLLRRNSPTKILCFVLQYFGHLFLPSQKNRPTSDGLTSLHIHLSFRFEVFIKSSNLQISNWQPSTRSFEILCSKSSIMWWRQDLQREKLLAQLA